MELAYELSLKTQKHEQNSVVYVMELTSNQYGRTYVKISNSSKYIFQFLKIGKVLLNATLDTYKNYNGINTKV